MLSAFKFNTTYFILLFTLLNLIQISLTELTSDEAYYWFYSLNLDWGYYDHPPVTGVLTYLGSLISNSEFGVRLFHTLILSTGLIFIFKLIPERQRVFAGILILALPLFNYVSFILFPDTALIGISAVLIFSYNQFLIKNDIKSALILGSLFGIALLCKYHAILIIFSIVLSNLRLLKNTFFYVSLLLAFFIFLPHFIWQYHHDFITFKYHLIGRNSSFKINYFFEYLASQIGIIGIGIVITPFLFKSSDQFEKSLKFIVLGTLFFFALSSVKGYVHLHWTSISLVPILLIASKFYYSQKSNYLLGFTVLPFVGIILFTRIYFMFNFLSLNSLNVDYYHGRPLWAEDIDKVAKDRPVVFNTGNSGLRESPMYSFYSGNFSAALFPGEHKKSQYQVLNYEDSIQSTDIMLINNDKQNFSLKTRMGKTIYYKEITNFTSFGNIAITSEYEDTISEQTPFKITAIIHNHRQDSLTFSDKHKIYIEFEDVQGEKHEHFFRLKSIGSIAPNFKKEIPLDFSSDLLPESEYTFIIGFSGHDISNSVNTKRSKIRITKAKRY
ncbi:MAG: hypothetical protein GKR88_20460 [Flavobacteriaceae bacterium]|nr:MAG: hypothetical protein GKR88_20460 [Flavobacteriaceae bacterium]